jgi:hypothetical protein
MNVASFTLEAFERDAAFFVVDGAWSLPSPSHDSDPSFWDHPGVCKGRHQTTNFDLLAVDMVTLDTMWRLALGTRELQVNPLIKGRSKSGESSGVTDEVGSHLPTFGNCFTKPPSFSPAAVVKNISSRSVRNM